MEGKRHFSASAMHVEDIDSYRNRKEKLKVKLCVINIHCFGVFMKECKLRFTLIFNYFGYWSTTDTKGRFA